MQAQERLALARLLDARERLNSPLVGRRPLPATAPPIELAPPESGFLEQASGALPSGMRIAPIAALPVHPALEFALPQGSLKPHRGLRVQPLLQFDAFEAAHTTCGRPHRGSPLVHTSIVLPRMVLPLEQSFENIGEFDDLPTAGLVPLHASPFGHPSSHRTIHSAPVPAQNGGCVATTIYKAATVMERSPSPRGPQPPQSTTLLRLAEPAASQISGRARGCCCTAMETRLKPAMPASKKCRLIAPAYASDALPLYLGTAFTSISVRKTQAESQINHSPSLPAVTLRNSAVPAASLFPAAAPDPVDCAARLSFSSSILPPVAVRASFALPLKGAAPRFIPRLLTPAAVVAVDTTARSRCSASPVFNAPPLQPAKSGLKCAHLDVVAARPRTPAFQRITAAIAANRHYLMAAPLLVFLAFGSQYFGHYRVKGAGRTEPYRVWRFVDTRWNDVRESVVKRASVEIEDDFRTGLSSWDGAPGWAKSWTYDQSGFVRTASLALLTPSMALADYDFEFLGQIQKKGIAWVYRASSLEDYYVTRLQLSNSGPLFSAKLVRYAVIQGKESRRAELPLPLTVHADTVYRVRVRVEGPNFSTWVQGQMVDFWSDEKLRRGGVGLFSAKNEQALVRWVRVTHQQDMLGRLCAYLAPATLDAKGK
jgi:hypothetical protein